MAGFSVSSRRFGGRPRGGRAPSPGGDAAPERRAVRGGGHGRRRGRAPRAERAARGRRDVAEAPERGRDVRRGRGALDVGDVRLPPAAERRRRAAVERLPAPPPRAEAPREPPAPRPRAERRGPRARREEVAQGCPSQWVIVSAKICI